MGRRLPPRVTYWTGTWDPAQEAISKEVNALRVGSRSKAPVVSFAPGQTNRILPRERVLRLSAHAWPVLRAVAAVVERRGDVTHVFGGRFSWHLLRALGRRPVLLTAVTSEQGPGAPLPIRQIAAVAVETDGAVAEWLSEGIPRERIAIVRPGIDLNWYAPLPEPVGRRFTLLFASTPSDPREMAPRGIPLLLELARLRPDLDLVIPWRPWGDVNASLRALDALRPPTNVIVSVGTADMRSWYAKAHATVVCFNPGAGKACPNFVLEGLASGRPALATSDVGISSLIASSSAGVVAAREPRALAQAVDHLVSDWVAHSERARRLAETHFDVRQFLAAYERLYRDVSLEAAS
jgi:glycosyltransferase involved in cell wall biosynthesis